MSQRENDFEDSRAKGLARLAALERLRDQAKRDRRVGMLKSIEQLIEQEARSLREPRDPDAEPRA